MNKQPMPPGTQAPLWERTEEEGGKARLVPWMEIGRDQILGRYWELANLEPQVTKGSISGQLKAPDSLREELALAAAEKHKNSMKRMPTPEIYQSAWMGRLLMEKTIEEAGPDGVRNQDARSDRPDVGRQ
jgi:hypothetical protein